MKNCGIKIQRYHLEPLHFQYLSPHLHPRPQAMSLASNNRSQQILHSQPMVQGKMMGCPVARIRSPHAE